MNKTKYDSAVEKCKKLIVARKEMKYEIAKLALSVCVIKVGSSSCYRQYSLSAFARDIGVAVGTLNRWKREYECVVIKIKPKKDIFPDNYAITQTLKEVNNETNGKEVRRIYQGHLAGNTTSEDRTLQSYLDRIKAAHFFICYKSVLNKLDKKKLETLSTYCREIVCAIDNKEQKPILRPSNKIISDAIEMVNQ